MRRRLVRMRVVVLLACVSLLASTSGVADGQTNAEIDRIREERREAEAAATAKAAEVDVADAELEEVSAALAAVNSAVNAQQGRVANAERQLAESRITLETAEAAVVEGELLIAVLEERLAAQAISSFVNQDVGSTVVVESDDPNLGLRMVRKHVSAAIDHLALPLPEPERRALRSALCRIEDPAELTRALRAAPVGQVGDRGPHIRQPLLMQSRGGHRPRIPRRILRPLVRMRVHRAAGPNSMWLPLFSGDTEGRVRRLLRRSADVRT